MKTIKVKDKWRVFLIPFILISFSVLLLFVTILIYRYHSDKTFLSETFIDSISLPNKTSDYSLKYGTVYKNGGKLSPFISYAEVNGVYKIGKLYRITLEDPLFGSDTNNIDKLSQSLSNLEKAHDELVKNAQFSKNIIPKKFLASIPITATANSNFLNTPTPENASTLFTEYDKSLTAYREELTTLKSNINSFYEYNVTDKDIVSIASITSTDIIQGDLTLALKNADVLAQEIEYRKKILSGWKKGVTKIINETKEKITNVDTPKELLPKNDLYGTNTNNISLEDELYQINTPCFSEEKTDEYLYIANIVDKDIKYKAAKLATNNFYIDTSSQGRYKDAYYDKGIKWIPSPPGTTYQCNNLEYLATLVNTREFYKEYNKNLILRNVEATKGFSDLTNEQKESLRELSSIEDEYFKKAVITEHNTNILKNAYYRSYVLLSNYELYEELRSNLLIAYKKINNNQMGVENIFDSLLYFDNLSQAVSAGYLNHENENYIYTTRNAYSLTFFNFSPTIWRLEEKPTYTKKSDRLSQSTNYSTFTELIKKYSRETLRSWKIYLSEI